MYLKLNNHYSLQKTVNEQLAKAEKPEERIEKDYKILEDVLKVWGWG